MLLFCPRRGMIAVDQETNAIAGDCVHVRGRQALESWTSRHQPVLPSVF